MDVHKHARCTGRAVFDTLRGPGRACHPGCSGAAAPTLGVLNRKSAGVAPLYIHEGAAVISCLSTFPVRFLDFEGNELFVLRVDFSHPWVFLNTRVARIEIRAFFKITYSVREIMKLHGPTPPNFFSDGQMVPFFG